MPGIYGGLGPLAHIRFELILIERNYLRGARTDQEHPDYVLVSAASTPDRTASLVNNDLAAADHMITYARILEQAGADFMMVMCNTAHAFHTIVQDSITIPWVHMVDATARHIQHTMPGVTRVGILGTNGTLSTRLYHTALTAYGITPIAPQLDSEEQALVMDAIYHERYGIKATGAMVSDEARVRLANAADWCKAHEAQVIIPACTEVSVALTAKLYPSVPIIDPLVVAADTMLDLAYGITQLSAFTSRSSTKQLGI